MSITEAGVVLEDKRTRYFGEKTGGMGRTDASQRSHTHKKTPSSGAL